MSIITKIGYVNEEGENEITNIALDTTSDEVVDMELTNDGYIKSGDGKAGTGTNEVTKIPTSAVVNNAIDKLKDNIGSVNSEISSMKTNFQDGVDTVYNAVKRLGNTPSDKTPAAIEETLSNITVYSETGFNNLTKYVDFKSKMGRLEGINRIWNIYMGFGPGYYNSGCGVYMPWADFNEAMGIESENLLPQEYATITGAFVLPSKLSFFVCVGGYGKSFYTYDMKNWIAADPGLSDSDNGKLYDGKSITYGGGSFLAGGENGSAFISNNGFEWTLLKGVKSPNFNTGSSIKDIVYGDGKFLMLGGVFAKLYDKDSGDAINVDLEYLADSEYPIKAAAYTKNFKKIDQEKGFLCVTGKYLLHIDNDGNAKKISSGAYQDIVYDNRGSFLCVGNYGIVEIYYENGKWIHTYEGKRYNISLANDWLDSSIPKNIAYGGGKAICLCENGYGLVIPVKKIESKNNIQFFYGTGSAINDITYGNGYFVCVGDNGKTYYWSNSTQITNEWTAMTGASGKLYAVTSCFSYF